MDFALNEDQATLQEVLRDFFDKKSPESAVREQMADPAGYDKALWRQMAEQLGLQSLALPEEYGGSGFTFVELGIALEEMGRALVVSPFFASCVMATQLLLAADDHDAMKQYLPAIASGELIGTVAIAEDSGSWLPADVTTTATESAGGWTISGHKSYVLDGAIADVVLVAARSNDRVGVFAVDGGTAGLTRVPLQTMDQTRKQARIEFGNTPAKLIGSLDRGQRAIQTMLDHSMIALSAEALGGTAKVLDMAVDYAKVREQFGRPIGSFQAIKHKCASMLVELESSRSAAYYALWAASAGDPDVPKLASLAKAFCADTYLSACGENIQIHGGIGFTWEHPAHLYLKRAKNTQLFLGSSDLHRQRLADLIGI
ncbi:acyl-CoA dehydrogenase family protein [Mycobacterium branderi]|uniref:Acyl-CoA dehydrogenase n=1 Tax=Mycobacterium branderi TaxID=43348 RepID=A0A7I7WBN9_9MYCO|nr:acyl-CoA dehydrogenase family protein [Mycobacterium branderi]MCV7231613.1 acyl-CoA/acyl-ACP dehydrogenase [Mycobacterium branderi]ORA40396.1 acyl-CoA dehydrogenase [Mycobacterium branderi]BBZ14904.1 acyl-CoA dehydrogenase [Mycobacterium branderi]